MTIQNASLWPLKVCCVILCFTLVRSAWAQADLQAVSKQAGNPLPTVLPLPPPDPEWIYNDAQWGPPNTPFLFSGNPLYTAGTFESGRQVFIGNSPAAIHVQGGASLHLTGVISNQEAGISGLEKFGAGTLVLSGQNSYLGNTQLHEGTLRVMGENALGRKINSFLAYQGSVVHYAAGASLFNHMHLRGSNTADESPANGPIPPASWALADSVQWRVDSGVAVQAGNVMGSVPIVKQGSGTLRFTGIASYPSFFTVNQGALEVDWHLAGAVQVNRGARLEGAGTVRTATIQEGGVLSPGSGHGHTADFTITEKLEFKPGAVFEVDATVSGAADSVLVAGKALLDGQVMTRASAGDWRPSTSYTVLHAVDGFDGTQFASAATNMPFLTPALSYDAQNVYLRLDRNSTPLDDAADTPTEEDVADVVDENTNPDVHDEIVVMDKPQAREAFNQLSGSWMASVRSAMLEDSRFIREAVLQNTALGSAWAYPACVNAAGCRQAPRFWSQAFYSSADRASVGGTPADTRDIGGLVLGMDRPVNADWRAGAFFGAQHSDMRRRHAMASARIASIHAGLSMAGHWRDVDLAVGLARIWHKIQSQRTVAVAGLRDALSGNYRGRTLQVFGEIAAPIRWFGKALAGASVSPAAPGNAPVAPVASSAQPIGVPMAPIISPFIRLAWVQARSSGFVEKGAEAALNVLPENQAILFSTLGLRAAHTIATPTGNAQIRGELAWRHASGNIRAFSRQSFRDSTAQEVFTSEGQPLARQAWSLQVGVQADLAKHTKLNLAYAGQYASRRQDHGAKVEVAWVF